MAAIPNQTCSRQVPEALSGRPSPERAKLGRLASPRAKARLAGNKSPRFAGASGLRAWAGLLADVARISKVPWLSLPTSQEPIQFPAIEEKVSDRPDWFELAPADQSPDRDLRNTQIRGGVP